MEHFIHIIRLAGILAFIMLAGCDTLAPDTPGNLVPRTVVEDPSLPAIELNGFRCHLETFGNPQNPVLIFLHGGPGGDYRSMLRLKDESDGYSLADDYFLIFWDQRGCGLSERVQSSSLNQETYLRDLLELTDRFSPDQPVNIVGHSWGGMYAALFMNNYPDRVNRAVLIEPGPLTGELFEEIRDDYVEINILSERVNDFTLYETFLSPDDHARKDLQLLLGYRDSQPKYHQDQENDPAPFWRMGAAASRYVVESGTDDGGRFNFDFTDNLAAFTRPVLLVSSSDNEVIGEAFQKRQAEFFPSAEVRVIPNSGHDCHWKKPGKTVALIRSWFGN